MRGVWPHDGEAAKTRPPGRSARRISGEERAREESRSGDGSGAVAAAGRTADRGGHKGAFDHPRRDTFRRGFNPRMDDRAVADGARAAPIAERCRRPGANTQDKVPAPALSGSDRKSTCLNSSHGYISYA